MAIIKVNLIDIDRTGFPNLALMKLSAWHKQQKHETYLNGLKGDINYVSCVFTKNKKHAERITDLYNCHAGGSGIDLTTTLPWEVEIMCPDYSLYPGLDYSIGFTSRGCIRKCGFCIVPEKEGDIKEYQGLISFVRHKKVKLLDNNFLASPLAKMKLEQMIEQKLIIDFNQGLDVRLLTDEFCSLLVRLNPPYLRFAWDNVKLETKFFTGIEMLRKAGFPISRNRIGCYVLIGFNSVIEEDVYRCEKLHSHGINTHVQVFGQGSKELKRLARWGNRPQIWNKCQKFRDYK